MIVPEQHLSCYRTKDFEDEDHSYYLQDTSFNRFNRPNQLGTSTTSVRLSYWRLWELWRLVYLYYQQDGSLNRANELETSKLTIKYSGFVLFIYMSYCILLIQFVSCELLGLRAAKFGEQFLCTNPDVSNTKISALITYASPLFLREKKKEHTKQWP